MKKLVVEGGVTLCGEVSVGGAKNAILPIMAAALLTREECIIRNCPGVADVETMQAIIASLGVEIEKEGSVIRIRAAQITSNVAPYDFVRKMRASICLLGALIARQSSARVSIPGGCVIGPRPIDLHIKGLAAMGIDIKMEHGYVDAVKAYTRMSAGQHDAERALLKAEVLNELAAQQRKKGWFARLVGM